MSMSEKALCGSHGRLASSARLGPLEIDIEPVPKRTLSPREKMLVHVMDRLAGIDVQRTFDLDGSGFVSTAVLRRSLITFDPQVFTEECIDLLFSRHLSRPCGRCGFLTYAEQLVHIHDVFGPFWQPFCRRLQHLEEKVTQIKRNAQRRQVELAQMAQDAAEALRKEKQEQPSLMELKKRLEESEQERTKLEERLWWANKDLTQQLQAASEQSRQGLEAERRKCSSRLEQAERDKKQLQKKLADADAAKKGESTSLAAVQEELTKCRKENDTLSAASAKDRQELTKLKDELEKQRQAFHKQRQQLHDFSAREEELRRELQQQSEEVAKCQQHVAETMAQRLVELKAEGEQRSRSEEARKSLEARCAQLEDELSATKQSLERREREAEDAVHRAVVQTRAELEEQFQGKLRGFESQLDHTDGRLKKAEEEKEDLTAIVGKISEELCQMQRDVREKQQQMSETHDLSKARLEQLREQRQQLLEQSSAKQKEFSDRLEFLSGEVIRLKLENATLEQQLGQRSVETTRFSQEKKALEEQVAQAKHAEEEAKSEQEKLQSELQVQRQLCQESQSKLASTQKEAQELSREFSRRGNQEKQLLDVSGCLYRLEEQMQEILLQWQLDGDAPAPAALASELRAKLEKRLETEKVQKEMVEARLAETAQALEAAQKQMAEKGWEAADALAAVHDEMARQRAVSDERHKLLEEEAVLLRRKMEDLLAGQSSRQDDTALRQKVELEVQLQSKIKELQEQSAYVKQLEDSARLAATQVAQAAASRSSEEERKQIAQLRSKLWACEDELQSMRSELEAFKKDASLQESRRQEQLEKQRQVEQDRDELKVKLQQCQVRLQSAQAEGELGETVDDEQLLVQQEKQQFHHQLQGVARDLTVTLKELETKAVADECPLQLGATKHALSHLQEQISSVCEELLVERPTGRKKKAGQQKSRGSAEHSTAAFKVLSAEHDELQSRHEQLQHDLHAAETELKSLREQLAEALAEKAALQEKLQAAASCSSAIADGATKLREQEAKIKALEKQLEETQEQLDQAQGDLEQEQLDAAEALVSAGHDLTDLENRADSHTRQMEGQLAEMLELHAKAEETVDLLTQELQQLKTSSAEQLAESDSRRKELEFHLEDTEQRLARAQDDVEQRSLDAAEALTELGEELAQTQSQLQASEAEVSRLRSMFEDNSDTSEQVGPLVILPEDRMSPKSITATIHSSEGSPSP